MTQPPPPPPHLTRIPCDYGACYSADDARALGLWAAGINRWAEDAWDLCRDSKEK